MAHERKHGIDMAALLKPVFISSRSYINSKGRQRETHPIETCNTRMLPDRKETHQSNWERF